MSSFTRDQNANGSLFAILGRAILAGCYLLVVFFFGLAGGSRSTPSAPFPSSGAWPAS